MSEVSVILVGGSKDGLVTDNSPGMSSIHNIVLNDALDGPEYIDRYVPAGVQNKDGQEVYVHVGRYNAEESETYWEKVPAEQIEELVNQTLAERAAEAEAAVKADLEAKEAAQAKETEEAVQSATEESVAEVTPESTENKEEAVEEVAPVVEAEKTTEDA